MGNITFREKICCCFHSSIHTYLEENDSEILDVQGSYETQHNYYITPNLSRHLSELNEEEQFEIAKRLDRIENLPVFVYNKEKTIECIICLCEFRKTEKVRCLPCLHIFHQHCVNDWLIRSSQCPQCMVSL